FARRIRRLERAADRIAGGRFDEPVQDSGGDELGDLAVAFERMRVRLARLDDARREFVANASHQLRTPLFSLAGFPDLMGDELRVFQIGRVLVENALLHTPPGTAVRVRALRRDGSAVLEVEDEGGEIPSGQREQLFERFYRLDGTRASGSGLGLAIAKELA